MKAFGNAVLRERMELRGRFFKYGSFRKFSLCASPEFDPFLCFASEVIGKNLLLVRGKERTLYLIWGF